MELKFTVSQEFIDAYNKANSNFENLAMDLDTPKDDLKRASKTLQKAREAIIANLDEQLDEVLEDACVSAKL